MSEIRLPSEWLTTNLEMIGEVVTGKTPSKKNSEYFGGAIPFIKPGDVNDQGNIEFTDEHLTELGAATVPTIPKGSIVVTCIGNLGRCAITTERSATNQQINSVLPFSNVDVKFIYYQMRTLKEWMVSESSATTVTIINKSKFSQAPLVLPPLAEQKVIAEKLDTLLAQVDNTKTRLERIPEILKRFRQSVLAAAVSGKLTEEWRASRNIRLGIVKKIGDVANVVRGGSPRPSGHPDFFGGDIPWITVKELTKDKFKYLVSTGDYLTELGSTKSRMIYEGTLLLTNSGATLGVPKISKINGCINDGVVAILNVEEPLKSYIYYSLLSMTEILRSVNQGAAQPNLNTGIVKAIEILIPECEEEQSEIVRRVEELFAFANRIEHAAQAALSRVNNLTQSILAKAFRGELTADWRAANPDLISGENSAEALLARIKAERDKVKPTKKAKAG
ncbi:restriction endonuclease subunit S [Arsukibacterium indicum]|uniref:Restriction endonuclease subunit S n=1 Tax=Arsukibacterium indicum TaxID=2848612 RepID=A0ABS6MIK2_9GAMM|nr:restriction endonuclease subunit S [Arsukibacterium indicum]MBV2128638.1 restriction endonuclease subunit S [Arsukibacterium indicum]